MHDQFFTGYRGSVRGGPHKEWFHFIVCTREGVKLLINFSVLTGVQSENSLPVVRAMVLVYQGGRWQGEILKLDSPPERGDGEINSRDAAMSTTERGFALQFTSAKICFDLNLIACGDPIMTNRTGIGTGSSLRWLAFPRMRAFGRLCLEGKAMSVLDAPAYHDHNWGSFRWGEDYAWDWAIVGGYSESAPVFIYCQFTDAKLQRCLSKTLAICAAGLPPETSGDSFSVRRTGVRVAQKVFRLPKGMRLALPGYRLDVPRSLDFEIPGSPDTTICFTPTSSAQIVVPGDNAEGADALLTESAGESLITSAGTEIRGWGVFEQLRRQT